MPDRDGRTRSGPSRSPSRAPGGLTELREAERWALDHLPEEAPATLIHGDLLGQNILLHWEQPFAVIDWEYARQLPLHQFARRAHGSTAPN
ncbi:phosphotransferase [Sorangium sp. So ce362]|uniref:phosphotransferase n=1 Tax=Sorangium sp. So ce362 TaxID=3133303 RepID=UPI003F61005D